MVEIEAFKQQVAAIFKDPDAHLQRWLQAVARHAWTLQLETSRVPLEELRSSCAKFLVSFSQAVMEAPSLELGAMEFREPLHTLTFVAGWMAGRGASFTDAEALVHGLEDVLPGPRRLFRAMELAVGEAYSLALVQQEQDHFKEVMARSQVVVALHSRLPCAFLVGQPDRWAVEEALARLLMLAMMQGTSVMIVDVSGALKPEALVPRLWHLLALRNREVKAHAIVSGLPPRLAQQAGAELPDGISLEEDVTGAVAAAGEVLGLAWQERGTSGG